jgi:hypothetical protein
MFLRVQKKLFFEETSEFEDDNIHKHLFFPKKKFVFHRKKRAFLRVKSTLVFPGWTRIRSVPDRKVKLSTRTPVLKKNKTLDPNSTRAR